jgi:hypothetical protein
MPAPVAGIHVFSTGRQDVDARDERARDDGWTSARA